MYVNAKMIHLETIPGLGHGRGKFKYDIFDHCKKFCKCHNVPPPSTTVKKNL
jgi:hypothetical protein